MTSKPPLIERPDLQTLRQRLGWAVVTLSAWGGWACLWRPLLLIVAWVIEVRRPLDHDLLAFLDSLRIHIALLLAAALTLVLWSLIDWWQRRRERMQALASQATHAHDLAGDFGIDLHLLLSTQKAPNMVLHLAKNGVIEKIDLRHRPGERLTA